MLNHVINKKNGTVMLRHKDLPDIETSLSEGDIDKDIMGTLTEREASVLVELYYKGTGVDAIANSLNTTTHRVFQIAKKASKKLRVPTRSPVIKKY